MWKRGVAEVFKIKMSAVKNPNTWYDELDKQQTRVVLEVKAF